jgi:tetratricopeptide (TPR) repeat protein
VKVKSINYFFLFLFLSVAASLSFCGDNNKPVSQKNTTDTTYLNLNDTVQYMGVQQCMSCHDGKHKTFVHTGMGMSFDSATKKKSAAKFEKHTAIYDKYTNFWYSPSWHGENLVITEYRLSGADTIFRRTEKVDYIIGSGQHTNSHIFNTNGYLHQMPMTFYTQKGKWDLPPGFENGANTRFSRKIGLECMSCHNALPQFEMGSENKFTNVPNGITCERCHGPGEIHVKQKLAGLIVDTSKYIDYTIVNPGKLPADLQFDVCQRCHLQGNAVLKDGKSFFSFKPGMKLSDVMTVFLPKYENADDEFIMASHADRLKQSKCFINTSANNETSNSSLKPYKNKFTCVTCHNPHVSVKETNTAKFNTACANCHTQNTCKEKPETLKAKQNNCVSCHMPKSGSVDIPHVTVTDHYIRVHKTKNEVNELKKFIGLFAINEKTPSDKTKAIAYIQQYEKFEYKPYYLDSAKKYLPDNTADDVKNNFQPLVHYYFVKRNYKRITEMVNIIDAETIIKTMLLNKTWDNAHAWCSYRIAESFYNQNNLTQAILFYKNADELAPFILEFKNNYARTILENGKIDEAKTIFEKIIAENNKFAPAYNNLGYVWLLKADVKMGEQLIDKSLLLDPDYELALINKAQVYILQNNFSKAKTQLQLVLKKYPESKKAIEALAALTKYING